MLLLIAAGSVAVVSAESSSGDQWTSSLQVTLYEESYDDGPSVPVSCDLTFGFSTDATDGVDQGLDEATPLDEEIDVYFLSGDEAVPHLITDIKNDASNITWNIELTVPSNSTVGFDYVEDTAIEGTLLLSYGDVTQDLKNIPVVLFKNSGNYSILLTLDKSYVPQNDVSPSTGSGGSSGGGGGGGGGSTGEAYANIAKKEVEKEYVSKDSVISYEFKEEVNAIDFIHFTSLKNSGTITATVEVLNGKSSFADSEPEGNVYQNMNIWVGKTGFSDSGSIEDTSIGFKVAKSWILENEIVESSIVLCRFNSDVWNQLSTEKIDEDDEYVYFEAQTPGFSPFAITGFTEEELEAQHSVPEQSVEEESTVENEDVPAPEAQDSPGLGIVAISGLLACAYLLVRRN